MSTAPLNIYLNLLYEAAENDIQIYVGGGMALYFRSLYPPDGEREERYASINPENRTTKDLDSFLPKSALTIPNPTQLEQLRDIIQKHGFTPVEKSKYWQWELHKDKAHAIIDLLTPPNEASQNPNDKRRVKPQNATNIHARKTLEAEGIDIHPVELFTSSGTINILSSYNLIILKLHACYDHLGLGDKDKPDVKQAEKHAFDIFRTIVDMIESDWSNAKDHLKQHKTKVYLTKACEIRHKIFEDEESVGTLALKNHPSYIGVRLRT